MKPDKKGGAGERGRELFKKGGILWLAVLLGLVLLLLPTGKKEEKAEPTEDGQRLSLSETEARLSELLSQVEGAGRVEVLLAEETGARQVLAQNETYRESATPDTEVVVLSGSDGEEPVTLQVIAPGYRGAVIVAEGGGDPAVALALTRAVGAVTGLGADKITVMKMTGSN